MRLLAIILGVLATVITAFFYLRFSGLQARYEPFRHPFFPEGRRLWLLDAKEESPSGDVLQAVFDEKAKDEVAHQQSRFGLVVHLVSDAQGTPRWQVGGREETSEALREFSQVPILFMIESQSRWSPNLIRDQIRDLNLGSPFAISCPADKFLESLRELEPLWIYGGGQGDLTRLATMTSLWVEPSLNIKSDFFFFPFRWHGVKLYQTRSLAEIHRRHKKFLIGPVHDGDELKEVLEAQPDGVVIGNRELFSLQK